MLILSTATILFGYAKNTSLNITDEKKQKHIDNLGTM